MGSIGSGAVPYASLVETSARVRFPPEEAVTPPLAASLTKGLVRRSWPKVDLGPWPGTDDLQTVAGDLTPPPPNVWRFILFAFVFAAILLAPLTGIIIAVLERWAPP